MISAGSDGPATKEGRVTDSTYRTSGDTIARQLFSLICKEPMPTGCISISQYLVGYYDPLDRHPRTL